MIRKDLFKKDYFTSWKIRKKFVELYKRCQKYCVDNNIEHSFDQYGYIKKENRYITVDELEPLFSMKVENVSKLIAEIRGLQDTMFDADYAITNPYYNPKLMDAKYPHVHWAYHCVKFNLSKEERDTYYRNQIVYLNDKNSQYKEYLFRYVQYPKIYHRKWHGIEYMIQKAEELLKSYGEYDLIGEANKRKIVFFTGSGISKESGIPTFRDSDGLWEQYPVDMVASSSGWVSDPLFVNGFYNTLRKKYAGLNSDGESTITPNNAHKNIVKLANKDTNIWNTYSKDLEIVIITQNVDNLHEQAIEEIKQQYNLNDNDLNIKVIHLHGELMKMCSSGDKENKKYHINLPYNDSLEFPVGAKVKDIFPEPENDDSDWTYNKDKLIRPYIVFFGEDVPNMNLAISEVETCDTLVVIGTSLNVYPAASLLEHASVGTPIIYIDPNPMTDWYDIKKIAKPASSGLTELLTNWKEYVEC